MHSPNTFNNDESLLSFKSSIEDLTIDCIKYCLHPKYYKGNIFKEAEC